MATSGDDYDDIIIKKNGLQYPRCSELNALQRLQVNAWHGKMMSRVSFMLMKKKKEKKKHVKDHTFMTQYRRRFTFIRKGICVTY